MKTPDTKILAGARVLCVDDDPDNLELLCIVLGNHGADVTALSSVEAAIACLKTSRFDVVISDIMMPLGMDGYDLAHALRQMESDDPSRELTPTLAVSGHATAPSKKRRFADFQVYMLKPFDHQRLVLVVERLVEADGESVGLGSLVSWEAAGAAKSAAVATVAARGATAAAVEGADAAEYATEAATAGANAAEMGVRAAERATAAAVKGAAAAQEATIAADAATAAAVQGAHAADLATRAASDEVLAAAAATEVARELIVAADVAGKRDNPNAV